MESPPIPSRNDGLRKLALAWEMPETEAKYARVRKTDFQTSDLDMPNSDGRWQGAWMLAQGGMSTTGLWVQVDEQDIVIDRVVRKDTYQSSRTGRM